MAFEFKLPDLGEGIHEAQIINVLVQEGQTLKEDQPILEVETDKAAVEIPVPKAGRVSKLLVKQGDTVKVGQVLVVIEEGGAEVAGGVGTAVKPVAGATTVAAAREEFTTPSAARSAVGGDGSTRVAAAATITPTRQTAPAPVVTPASPAMPVHKGPVPATPAVRRVAREMNVDLRLVPGSGPGGRVLQEDVERFAAAGGAANPEASTLEPPRPIPASGPAPAGAAGGDVSGEGLPDFSQWGPITREAVPQIRKTIARQMARAWQMVPRVTHGEDADLTDLEELRKAHAPALAESGGVRLTLSAFLLKALAAALRQHPKLNASYDDRTHEIIWKHYVHIGVAVDSPRGLVVPVLRDVDKKSIATIARELNELSERIRQTKFDIAELRGGTFTLSNVGALGGTFSTPMVNYPETAILVTGRLAKKPVVRDERIVIRNIMPLSLSFDHRIIDGADAARFSKTLVGLLENPTWLLLNA